VKITVSGVDCDINCPACEKDILSSNIVDSNDSYDCYMFKCVNDHGYLKYFYKILYGNSMNLREPLPGED